MAEGYEAGTAYIRISPDTDDFAEELEAKVEEAAAGAEAKVHVGADDEELQEVLDRAKAKLDELDGKTATAKLGVESGELDAGMDEARDKLADFDERRADAQLGLVKDEFDAGADDARAKLDELDGSRAEPTLGLNDDEFQEKLDKDKAELKSANSESGSGSLLGAITMGVGSIMPGLGGAAAGLGMLGGVGALAFGGIAKALSEAHQASQTLGMTGAQVASQQFSNAVQVQQAQQQVSQAERQSAQDSVTSSAQIEQAQQSVTQARQQAAEDAISSADSIEQAEMNLASVERNAAASQIEAYQQVQQAQQGVEEADYSLSEAQYQLSQAWEQAKEQVTQLTDALNDSKLNTAAASLAVQQAEYNENLVNQNAYSTDLDRQQAVLAVAQAKQQLVDATDAQSNAQYAADHAQQSSQQTILQAQQQVTQATYGQTNAQTALQDANRNATLTQLNNTQQVQEAQMQLTEAQQQAAYTQQRDQQQIAQAEQNLNLAEEQAAYQRQQDAVAVSQAQQNLTNTVKEQQLAWAATLSTQNQAANQFAADMAKLTPAGRAFVDQILSMRGAWKQFEAAAQDAVLPGATVLLKGVQSVLPILQNGVSQFASAMGNSLAQFGRELQSGAGKSVLQGLIQNGLVFANTVLPAFAQFGAQLADLGSKNGAVTGLADALAGIGRGLAGFAHGLTPYIPAFDQLLQVIGKIAQALGPALAQDIGAVANALLPLARFLNSKPGGPFIDGIAKVIGALITFKGVMKLLPDFITGPLSKLAGKGLDKFLVGPFKSAGGAIKSALGDALSKAWTGANQVFLKLVGDPMSGWFSSFASGIGSKMSGALSGVTSAFGRVFGSSGTVSGMISGLKGMVTGLPEMMGGVVDAIKGWGIWSSIASAATKVWSGIQAAFDVVMDANPIVLVTAAIIAIGVAVVEAYKHFAWFRDGVQTVFKGIEDAALFMWHNVFDPMWQGIEKGAEWLYDNGIKPYFDMTMAEWHVVEDAANWLWHNVLDPVWHGIAAGAEWLYNNGIRPNVQFIEGLFRDLENAANWMWHNVFDPVWHGIENGASAFVSAFKSTWNTLEGVFKTPVNFLINTVYDGGIRRFWNDIVNAIGLKSLDLPNIPGLAHGGVMPGYSPGHDTMLAAVSPGEGILTPQATHAIGGKSTVDALNNQYPPTSAKPAGGSAIGSMIAKLPEHQARRHMLERPAEHILTAGKFATGGIVGDATNWLTGAAKDVGSFVSGVVGGAIDTGKIIAALATGNTTALSNALGAFAKTDAQAAGLAKVMVAIPKTIAGDLVQAITGLVGGGGGKGGTSTPVHVSGSVASWFQKAVQLTGVGAGWIPDLETIAHYESSDNPNAINNSDSNAAAGDPSRGIMQTIMSTFTAYHQPGTSMNIYDPVANIAAAINYIRARYGTVADVPGIRSLASGGGYVGYDSGGWLPPGPQSQIPVNQLGQPEAVLTPQESQAFVALVRRMLAQPQGVPGQGVTVVQQYNGTQLPSVEQQAIMNRNLTLALSGG